MVLCPSNVRPYRTPVCYHIPIVEQGKSPDTSEQIARLAPRIHAATAELVTLAAQLDDEQVWMDAGMRSCAHWLTVNIGVALWTGAEMVRVGHALRSLPCIAAAFTDGRLSFDKVRSVTMVAQPQDDEMWLGVALHASGAQLNRICRAVLRSLDAADPRRADDELAHRGVRVWWRGDGMLELLAVLPREDGAVVMAAIEAAATTIAGEHRRVEGDLSPIGPLRLSQPTLRADALVRVCEDSIALGSAEPVVAPTRQMVVHVDSAVLANGDISGRSHVEGGPWLSPESVRWLSCDSDVVTIAEREGLPIDVGRVRRVIPPRLRLALQARDQGCRFPGCSVPAGRAEGHHIKHWADGGRTDLANLVSLCRFHHRQHHHGNFKVRVADGGDIRFETKDGDPLPPLTPKPTDVPLPDPSSDVTDAAPRALSGGERCDYAYAVSVLADASAARRAAPNATGQPTPCEADVANRGP
jgi:Domain of unknown function (DUF222)/HNH endonuclease